MLLNVQRQMGCGAAKLNEQCLKTWEKKDETGESVKGNIYSGQSVFVTKQASQEH